MGVVVVGESGRDGGSLWAGGVFRVDGEEEVGSGEGEDVDLKNREGRGICIGYKSRKEV